jgi:O-antigen ligase
MESFRTQPLHKKLFYLLVLCLPLGTRLYLNNPHEALYGSYNAYTGWEVYLIDIVIGLMIASWVGEKLRSPARAAPSGRQLYAGLFFFAIAIGLGIISLINAVYVDVALFRLVKLAEWAVVVWYVSSQHFSKRELLTIGFIFVGTMTWQCFLAWYQFVGQRSLLPGVWQRLLGESSLVPWGQAVSLVYIRGHKIMRPYGTFPHPNILAGFLVVSIIITFVLWLMYRKTNQRIGDVALVKRKFGDDTNKLWCAVQAVRVNTIVVVLLAVQLATLVITLSRTAWFVLGLLTLLVILLCKDIFTRAFPHLLKNMLVTLILGAIVLIPIIVWRVATLHESNAISLVARMQLNRFAWNMISHNPLNGVGIGQFVIRVRDFDMSGVFDDFVQPVHNVFLLLGAEMGIAAIIAFVGLIASLYILLIERIGKQGFNQVDSWCRAYTWILLFVLISCTVIMFFDHYLWTLEQGAVLWWVLVGMIAGLYDQSARGEKADRQR